MDGLAEIRAHPWFTIHQLGSVLCSFACVFMLFRMLRGFGSMAFGPLFLLTAALLFQGVIVAMLAVQAGMRLVGGTSLLLLLTAALTMLVGPIYVEPASTNAPQREPSVPAVLCEDLSLLESAGPDASVQ